MPSKGYNLANQRACIVGPEPDRLSAPAPRGVGMSADRESGTSLYLILPAHAMDYSGSDDTPPPHVAEHDRYVASYPPEDLDTEFKRKYPPDPFGEEMSANARVWKVYKDEATAHDKSLLDGWNKTLDILLIFAGLFSAVATAFVIESYKLLQPDYEQYIAGALFAALTSHNGSGALSQVLDLPNPDEFAPLGTSRWLNGVWFTSLLLSLIVAFLCILLKQCVEEYSSRVSAPFPSLRHWSRRRTFYFDGMTEWAVPVLIAVLPLLLHAAVFLFLTGLSILLWNLDIVNAVWILTVTTALLLFYAGSTLVPFIQTNCPSSPLHRLLAKSISLAHLRVLSVISRVAGREGISHGTQRAGGESLLAVARRWTLFGCQYMALLLLRCIRSLLPPPLRSYLLLWYWKLWYRLDVIRARLLALPSGFLHLSQDQRDVADAHALGWLITACPTSEVVSVGLQAAGALSPWSGAIKVLRSVGDLRGSIERGLKERYPLVLPRDIDVLNSADAARDMRSLMTIWGPGLAFRILGIVVPYLWRDIIAKGSHYDLPIIYDAVMTQYGWQDPSPFISRLKQSYSVYLDPSPPPHLLTSTLLSVLNASDMPLRARLYICRMVTLRSIRLSDFIQMAMGFLPYCEYQACPLSNFHKGRSCTLQCSYELVSELANRRQSLSLDIDDAHAALDIILNHARLNSEEFSDAWIPIHRSQLLQLLGSDIFPSHSAEALRPALFPIVRTVRAMAHCYRTPGNLPQWTAEWASAIEGILTVTMQVQRRYGGGQRGTVSMELTLRHICSALARMFDVQYSTSHVNILPTDATSCLPIQLLRGSLISSWEMLTSLSVGQALPMNDLTDLLAASLCTAARRGVNVDVEFDTFVVKAGWHLKERLYKVMRCDADSIDKKRVFRIARHCEEIRPGWLADVLGSDGRGRSAEDDDQLRIFANEIEANMSQVGKCAHCPTVNAGILEVTLRVLRHRLALPSVYGTNIVGSTFEEERARWFGSRPHLDPYRPESP